MRKIVALCWLQILLITPAFAQTPRELLLDQVEAAYLRLAVLPPDSPIVDMWLQAPRAKNPQASEETWRTVKQELWTALSKVIGQKGGVLDKFLRRSMDGLSDSELERMGQILTDPVYARFQQTMTTPEAQKQLMQVMVDSALTMQGAMNEVLRQYGLREVH